MGKTSLLFVLFVSFFVGYKAILRYPHCNLKLGLFSDVSFLRLRDSVLGPIIPDIARPELCVKECIDHKQCLSVNYNNGTNECELLRVKLSHTHKPKEVEVSNEWVHYEEQFYNPLVSTYSVIQKEKEVFFVAFPFIISSLVYLK